MAETPINVSPGTSGTPVPVDAFTPSGQTSIRQVVVIGDPASGTVTSVGANGVKVDGSGVTQPVSGSVTAAVSGSVAVTSMPEVEIKNDTGNPIPVSGAFYQATQPVSGTFFQATQPVSAASLPLPAGAAADGTDATGVTVPSGAAGIRGWLSGIYSKLSGTLGISGTVSVSNFPTTQPVSGSVSVSNFPSSQAVTGTFYQATQPVSAASLPLPSGAAMETGGNLSAIVTNTGAAATSANQTNGTQISRLTDGTNMAKVMAGDTNGLQANANSLTQTFTLTGSQSAGTVLAFIDTNGYSSFSVNMVALGTGASSITVQGSNNNSSWANTLLTSTGSSSAGATATLATVPSLYEMNCGCRYIQIILTAAQTAGTTTVSVTLKAAPTSHIAASINNSIPAGGNLIGYTVGYGNYLSTVPANATGSTYTTQVTKTGDLRVTAGRGSLTDGSGTITTAGTAQSVFSSNTDRRYFLFQNNSSAVMWINFTSTAVASQPSIMVAAGASFIQENGFVSTDGVTVICGTSGSTYTAKQA